MSIITKITTSCTVLLFLCSIAFCQQFPTEKSAKHVQIPGTNIFLIPPASFESSPNFKGFQNPKNQTSMIMAMEIPAPYVEVIKGFNPELLEEKDIELKTKNEIKIAGFEGLLLQLEQAGRGMIFSKQILVYGDSKSSTLINGICLKDSLRLRAKIEKSLWSTFIDTALEVNARKALDYSMNENAGSLQFHSVLGSSMVFNRDLNIPTASADKATLVTDKAYLNIEIKNKKSFCRSRLKEYPDPYSVIESKGIVEIELDKLKGYALFARNDQDKNEEMYQVIVFNNNGGYYLFVGTYLAGSQQAISDIKSIIATFERE